MAGQGLEQDVIAFAADLIPLILSGAKTLTYRLESKDSYERGNSIADDEIMTVLEFRQVRRVQ